MTYTEQELMERFKSLGFTDEQARAVVEEIYSPLLERIKILENRPVYLGRGLNV